MLHSKVKKKLKQSRFTAVENVLQTGVISHRGFPKGNNIKTYYRFGELSNGQTVIYYNHALHLIHDFDEKRRPIFSGIVYTSQKLKHILGISDTKERNLVLQARALIQQNPCTTCQHK